MLIIERRENRASRGELGVNFLPTAEGLKILDFCGFSDLSLSIRMIHMATREPCVPR